MRDYTAMLNDGRKLGYAEYGQSRVLAQRSRTYCTDSPCGLSSVCHPERN